jgi:hypothetical protein
MGIVLAFAWLGHGLGGYQGGLFHDLTGAYDVSFANAALAGVINLIIVGTLYFTIKRRRIERSAALEAVALRASKARFDVTIASLARHAPRGAER